MFRRFRNDRKEDRVKANGRKSSGNSSLSIHGIQSNKGASMRNSFIDNPKKEKKGWNLGKSK